MSGSSELKVGQRGALTAKARTGTRRGKEISQEVARRLFDYDPDTGIITRRVDRGKRWKAGDPVSHIARNGYLAVRVDGIMYFAHRLAWLLVHGYFPEGGIDHINKCPSDNRLCNLREISMTCNIRNSRLSKANKSGVKGANWHTRENSYISQITVAGRSIRIKASQDFVEAVAHRLAAEQCLGWSGCDSSSPAYLFMKDYTENSNERK